MNANERLGISTGKQDVEKFLGKDEEIKYGVFTLQRHHFGLPHSTQPILKFKKGLIMIASLRSRSQIQLNIPSTVRHQARRPSSS